MFENGIDLETGKIMDVDPSTGEFIKESDDELGANEMIRKILSNSPGWEKEMEVFKKNALEMIHKEVEMLKKELNIE